MKILELNKFYLVHDGSKTGHPGLLVWKDDDANLYLLVKFGSSENEHNFKLIQPISSNLKTSFVYKRPFVGKRKDVGREISKNIKIKDSDSWILIAIPKNSPVFSKTLSKKDKRNFNYLYRKAAK